MASRIFWVLLAGAALVTGIVLQDGGSIMSLAHESERSATIEAGVDRAIDRAVENASVVTIDGREVRVSDAQKDAMAAAISRLVKAEGNLAAAKIGRSSDAEVQAATDERDRARTEMEQIKAQMIAQKDAQRSDAERTRRETEKEIRDEVRESIREAVRG